MKVLLAIDSVFAWLWHWPLRLFCGLTGRSNFFFARVAVILSALCMVWAWVVSMILEPSIWTGIHAAFGITLWVGLICGLMWLHIKNIQARQSQAGDVLVGCGNLERLVRSISAAYFVFDSVLLAPWLGLLDPLCWIGFALYFAYDFQPSGKSWLRQGIDALKSRLASVHLPSRRWTPGLQGSG